MTKRNWIPVLRGEVYCSPACGGNETTCTKAKYDQAVKKSNALAKRMGRGWQTKVWENLGWYYKVFNGILEIYPPQRKGDTYSGWVQSLPAQYIAHEKTPEEAIAKAVREMDNHISLLQKHRKLIPTEY